MSLTAAVVLIVFLIFTFQNATLERIIKNLPYIIGDQEHVYIWNDKIEGYIRIFRKHYLGVVVVPILVSVIARIDKKRVQHGWVYMGLTAASVLPYIQLRCHIHPVHFSESGKEQAYCRITAAM